ncbi:deoxynucleoside kinase [Oceanobacillus caeni]|uniref:Deoxyguanosine kinase n=1 Tax=Oceanobacillus caeni TaxID=405946 RepID=A0ABR5MG98_9BACI|nr:deoxynucleoside kinase [Oceanobacillus caeni]KPH71252.1 deoxyguanosine kinase [Oceanobacillus caeni]
MANIPFITIEGPIGIGKTSLAKKLSSHYNFHLLKEIVEENPFLDKFYENMEAWSFQTEMFFLCNRFKQLDDIKQQYLSMGKPVMADYHIFKNMIFAQRTLSSDKMIKFEKIYEILTEDMPMPNMIIYLHASIDTMMNRIKRRGRTIEKNIQASYLEQLSSDYEDYINYLERSHPDLSIIRIDGDIMDFVQYQSDLEGIIQMVDEQLRKLA